MIFLGIDPGYARLGYGVISCPANKQKPSMLTCGVIETASNTDDANRLLEIEAGLKKLIEKYSVNFCAIEEVFFKKNLTTGIKLIQARGVILLTLARFDIECAHINPKLMKKMITGYGAADKKQVQQMITRILNLEAIPQPDDAADGLSFALCAWLQHKSKGKTIKVS